MKWLVLLLISILCPSCIPLPGGFMIMEIDPTVSSEPQKPQSINELGFHGNTPGVHPGDFFIKIMKRLYGIM